MIQFSLRYQFQSEFDINGSGVILTIPYGVNEFVSWPLTAESNGAKERRAVNKEYIFLTRKNVWENKRGT
jgi:hypothetical protein